MSYIDVKKSKNDVEVWYRENGKLVHKRDKLPLYCYVKSAEGEYESIFGDRLSKVTFDKFWEYRDFIDTKSASVLFESDIGPEYKYLSDNFYKFNPNEPMNIGFYDIEVHPRLTRGKGYPTPYDPHGEILSISLFIKFENRYHMFYLHPSKIDDLKDVFEGLEVVHHRHDDELTMLNDFISTIKDVDALADWNGEGYDIPMLINRIRYLTNEDFALRALCRNNHPAFEREITDDFGNERLKYDLVGRAHFDMLQLYKNFEGNKMSYKLDVIAEEELGTDYMKVDYDGTLEDFYENDPENFFRYSLVDTQILKWIDEKKQHIDLAIQMGRLGTVRYKDVLGSVKQIEMGIRNYCHYDRENPVILPNKQENSKDSKIQGAYVFPTKKGRSAWGFTSDLSSLYPSTICALNISPETFIFQCMRKQDDFYKVVQGTDDMIEVEEKITKETLHIKASELRDLIFDEGLTISANGSIFRSDQSGVIPEYIKSLLSLRKTFKKKMGEADNDVDRSRYNIYQLAYKLLANSTYGCMTNKGSRFFDTDIGQSITITGQHINRFQAIIAKKAIEAYKGDV